MVHVKPFHYLLGGTEKMKWKNLGLSFPRHDTENLYIAHISTAVYKLTLTWNGDGGKDWAQTECPHTSAHISADRFRVPARNEF